MIDELVHLEFPEFTEEFLISLKKEVLELLKLSTSLRFDFEGEDIDETARLYRERVKEKARAA